MLNPSKNLSRHTFAESISHMLSHHGTQIMFIPLIDFWSYRLQLLRRSWWLQNVQSCKQAIPWEIHRSTPCVGHRALIQREKEREREFSDAIGVSEKIPFNVPYFKGALLHKGSESNHIRHPGLWTRDQWPPFEAPHKDWDDQTIKRSPVWHTLLTLKARYMLGHIHSLKLSIICLYGKQKAIRAPSSAAQAWFVDCRKNTNDSSPFTWLFEFGCHMLHRGLSKIMCVSRV